MVDFDSGIDHGYAHTFAGAILERAARFVQAERTNGWS
jgi:hypothetical protein